MGLRARAFQEGVNNMFSGLSGVATAMEENEENKRARALQAEEDKYRKDLEKADREFKQRIDKRDYEFKKQKFEFEKQKFDKDLKKKNATIKEPSANEKDAATFAKRLEQAENNFIELEKGGFDRAGLVNSFVAYASPNFTKGGKLKRQEQAERNFVNALLRRESGAAISDQEFESAEAQYFPRAGDNEAVKEQKRQNRELAIQGMRSAAGARALSGIQLKNSQSSQNQMTFSDADLNDLEATLRARGI